MRVSYEYTTVNFAILFLFYLKLIKKFYNNENANVCLRANFRFRFVYQHFLRRIPTTQKTLIFFLIFKQLVRCVNSLVNMFA